MSEYVTKVSVWFNSEGASPSIVIKKMLELGFIPVRGAYDFVYEHEQSDMSESDLSESILEIADALHKALSGFRVFYTLDTLPKDESEYIPLADIDAELDATRKELEEMEREAE
ncbi:MAG: hypothetical protein ACFFER_04855 [Candidatus Thorarchaeota archaeon]